jgi:hypothetical protein
MSSLNRLSFAGTTNRPEKLGGAELKSPLALAAGQAQITQYPQSDTSTNTRLEKNSSEHFLRRSVLTFALFRGTSSRGNLPIAAKKVQRRARKMYDAVEQG